MDGWSNLCRLSSTLALRHYPSKPCPLDILSAYSKELIALTEHPQPLLDIFNNRLYVALRYPVSAPALSTLARKLALPAVVVQPVYYQNPEQARLQRTLSAIRLNQTITTISKEALAPTDAWFMSPNEIEERFKEYPEALSATLEIAVRCKFDLPIGKSQMPVVPLPEGITATQHLRNAAALQ